MNPPNLSAGAPLTNKLILLMLTGIFICLVLLVIRSTDRPTAVAPNVAVSVTSAPEPEPKRESVAVIAPQPSVRRVVASAPSTPVIAVTTQPASAETAQEAPVTVSQTIFLPPGSGPRGGSRVDRGIDSINAVAESIARNSSVIGRITLVGQPSLEIPIDLGRTCGKFAPPATTRHYVVGEDGGLANVFVYIADAKRAPVTGPGPLLDQIGCMYEPYMLGVGVNQKFGIRNSDPEMHNVHATPRNNKEFNFAQMAGSAVMLRSFDKPEVLVRLKCDVHPWMFAYVGVVDHPWFAVSDTNGVYQIPAGLPAGRYQLSAVHVKSGGPAQIHEIDVKSGQPTLLNLQFIPVRAATPQTTQLR